MKNFTNNFKKFTSRLSARWLIMALMMLVGTSSAWGWGYKSAGGSWNDCTSSFSSTSFYTTPTASTASSYDILMMTNPGSGFNICQNACKDQQLYVALTGTASSSSSTIVRAVAKWNNGLYCTYTVVIPEGKIYIKPTNGTVIEMTKSSYSYTAELELSSDKKFDLYASDPGASITNQNSMPNAGKPTSVCLNYTDLVSDYQYVRVTYNLETNQITFEEMTPPCDKPDAPDFGTNGVEVCEGTQVTLPTIAGVTLKWYDENNQEATETFNATENKTYYAVVVGDCESDKTPYTITIKTKPTITLNPTENTVCSGVALEGITRYVEIESTEGSQISWYATEHGGDPLATSTPLMETSYFAEATLNGCASDRAEFTIKGVLSAPTEVPDVTAPESICDGESAVLELKNKDAKYTYTVNEEEVEFTNNEYTVLPTLTTDYIVSVRNKCGSLSTTKTITVNPKPSIGSITQNVAHPVPFEDVVLTANNVTDGAQVKWYVEENLVAENTNTYTVTSETAGDVTVKAKAFLNGCESGETSHTVIFSAENCTPEPSDDIQITFTHPAKNNNNAACQYWGFGDLYYSTNNGNSYTKVSPSLGASTSGSITKTISNLTVDKIKVYFQAYYEFTNCKAKTTVVELDKGYSYSITISSDEQGNGLSDKNISKTCIKTGSLTHDPDIIAPAVKMVSAEYDEVNDKIVAKGAVYKTGCGETFWGFQYSRNGQTWGTTDEYFIRPSTGNSLSVPGEFDYSFAIPNANGGETYYIRAYALNNYNKDNYKLSSAVYSTTSLPVEIPSKTIESATISLVDSEGKPSTDTKVCPQSTVYLKVAYVGGDFTDFVAEENFPGTNLELVNHDKAKNEAIFSYTATTTGVANITISNENTSVTPETGVNIAVKEVAVATPPTIYLEKNTICDNQTTNVVVNSPIVGFIYSLKNGSVGDPVTYESGDLKFSVSKEGSYTVQVQETVCETTAISAPVDLRVITSDVKITLTTDVNTITPWQPLTLTVKAPSGYDYDLQGLDGMVYTKKGDVYTIKIPRPEGEDWKTGNTSSPEGTATKTFTASIKAGEDTSCSTTTKEVTLVDTEEECLAVGN